MRRELSPRLRALAAWIPEGARLADVGTDHGYLTALLLREGRIRSAIASDLRPGPLDRARETARKCGVADRISFRLCDGLGAVGPEECDTVVIAGMGGENIASILAAAPWTADGRHTLLLQPQSRAEVLRAFLQDHGYAIRREALVRDRGHLYPVMEAGAGEMHLSPGRLYGGALLWRDPLADRYWIEKIVQLQSVVVSCGRAADPDSQARADALRELIAELMNMREVWRHANSPGN